jgi:putative ABC transport system ATP-binding protein
VNDLLHADGLRKSFAALEVVREANLRIASGEIVAVMGRSGSGKTTLLHLLAGLEQPTAGRILYRGEDISGLDEEAWALWRRANVGLVFQAFHLIPTLSALENVAFPLYPMKMSVAERRARANARLAQMGLADRVRHLPARLSGGEQQRVAIARALVNNPMLILADEPTGNLDSATGEEILALFKKLRAETGAAFLIVTHDDKVAAAADRVLRMTDGVLADGKGVDR